MFCTIAPVRTPKMFSTERKIDDQDGGEVLRVEADIHVAQHHRAEGDGRNLPEMQYPVRRGDRRKEDAEKLAECHADGGDGSGLDDQEERPAVEKSPERAQRFAQINVLAAGTRHHGGQFAVGQRAGDGQETGHQPGADQQRGRVGKARDVGGDDEDAGADHGAHDQRGRAGKPQAFYELAIGRRCGGMVLVSVLKEPRW